MFLIILTIEAKPLSIGNIDNITTNVNKMLVVLISFIEYVIPKIEAISGIVSAQVIAVNEINQTIVLKVLNGLHKFTKIINPT